MGKIVTGLGRDDAIQRLATFRREYEEWVRFPKGTEDWEVAFGANETLRPGPAKLRPKLTEDARGIERLIAEAGLDPAPVQFRLFDRAAATTVLDTLDRSIGIYREATPLPSAPAAPGADGSKRLTIRERIENHPLPWAVRIALVLPRSLDGGERVSLVGGHCELERGARTRADGAWA